jgi:hypothetical protein
MKKKKEISIDELCEGLPDAFPEFMKYCRGLGFTQAPDFTYINGLFRASMEKNQVDPTIVDFIWNKNRLFLEKESLK